MIRKASHGKMYTSDECDINADGHGMQPETKTEKSDLRYLFISSFLRQLARKTHLLRLTLIILMIRRVDHRTHQIPFRIDIQTTQVVPGDLPLSMGSRR